MPNVTIVQAGEPPVEWWFERVPVKGDYIMKGCEREVKKVTFYVDGSTEIVVEDDLLHTLPHIPLFDQ